MSPVDTRTPFGVAWGKPGTDTFRERGGEWSTVLLEVPPELLGHEDLMLDWAWDIVDQRYPTRIIEYVWILYMEEVE